MVKTTEDQQLDQQRRLEAKTQDQRLVNEVVEGTGMSPWEARVVVDVVREVYFNEPGNAPIRSGQMRYECVKATEGAGKPLRDCQMTGAVLTLTEKGDAQLQREKGMEGRRRHLITRLTEEAREQGGLLSQEDLSLLLHCDVRTIRRDIAKLRDESEIHVATRGQQKDIGPGVTHRGVAIRKWLEGNEPQDVARAINHSLTAVERYIQHFSRVVFLGGRGFEKLQIAFTVGISTASVGTYLEIYSEYKSTAGFKNRLAELKTIGGAHFEGGDEKKAKRLPVAGSTNSILKPIKR
jgi:hypothetical protein